MRIIIVALLCLYLLSFTVAKPQKTQANVSGCDVCQFFVHQIETQVPKYEGQITEEFKKLVCARLGRVESACDRFVDAYGVKAIKYLLNKFDKLNVCHKLNLCTDTTWIKSIMSADEAFLIYRQMQAQAAYGETPYCGVCQFAIANLEQYVNASESDIEKQALKVCKMLPPQYEQLCDTLVLMYLPNIIEQLLQQLPPHVACCKLTLCQDNCNNTKTIELPKKKEVVPVKPTGLKVLDPNNQNCAVCQFIVSNVENYLASNATQQYIINELTTLCTKLPPQFTQVCTNVATNWVPYIIYYLEQKYPPQKVCELIGICPKTVPLDVKMLPVGKTPSDKLKKISMPNAKDGQFCQVCTLAMTMLQQYINANSTDAQIKLALENLCQKLPSTYVSMCTAMVDTYEPLLINMVRQYIASHQLTEICHDIGLCQTNANHRWTLTPAEKKMLRDNSNNIFCSPCMAVVSLAEQQLSKNTTRQAIKDKLLSLCDEIPSEQIAGLCRIAVIGKTDELIDAILSYATPSEVCTVTGLCSDQKVAAPKQGSQLACSLCTEIVAIADNYITADTTVSEIKQFVERVACTKLPADYVQVCNAYVEEYAAQLISAFVQGLLEPTQVCNMLHMCPANGNQNRINVH
jgi:saposin